MLTQLTFSKKIKETIKILGGEILLVKQTIEGIPFVSESPLVLGVDPGKYFGMALIGRGKAILYSGVLDESEISLREAAFRFIRDVALVHQPDVAVVEGASYNERYGQVKLAEIRCGFSLGLSEQDIPVSIVAPKKPRKVVFGNGDIEAMNVWVSLNHNAADALCLALMPHYDGRRPSDEIQGLVAKRHK